LARDKFVSISVDTSDAEQVLARFAAKATRQTKQAVAEAALDIQRYAKRAAPVRTGFLRNSIIVDFIHNYSAQVSAHANYSAYVEYGTYKANAQPYMRPAAEKAKDKFYRMVKEAYER
jgi:HK97 gp10 family phage protein